MGSKKSSRDTRVHDATLPSASGWHARTGEFGCGSKDYRMEWLTVREAAEFAKVSEKTIRRWYGAGRLEVDRLGPRLVRVRKASLLSVAA